MYKCSTCCSMNASSFGETEAGLYTRRKTWLETYTHREECKQVRRYYQPASNNLTHGVTRLSAICIPVRKDYTSDCVPLVTDMHDASIEHVTCSGQGLYHLALS